MSLLLVWTISMSGAQKPRPVFKYVSLDPYCSILEPAGKKIHKTYCYTVYILYIINSTATETK